MNFIALIGGSVGRGGTNASGDVKLVQGFLTDWLCSQRREKLVIDGICGPKTIAAIELFQQVLALPVKDGRIDPHGPTIQKLMAFHFLSIAKGMKGVRSAHAFGGGLPNFESGEFLPLSAGENVQSAVTDYFRLLQRAAPKFRR